MKKKYIVIILFCLIFSSSILISDININIDNLKSLAGVFFYKSITETQLRIKYALAKNNASSKIKILIVPGHEKEVGGTSYGGVRESELNVQLAEYLATFLSQEKRFSIYLLRNRNGYNKEFLTYINTQKKDILNFRKEHKDIMDSLVKVGVLNFKEGVEHINALPDMVTKLYGINKWANDIGIDIIIHVHFNDYPERRYGRPGKYSGFSIFIPEKQYSNYGVSHSLAESISDSLSRFFAISDYPQAKRKNGIVEDQELIAIGAFNTLDPASLLLEYGFIYEPQFINKNTREVVLKELAVQTYVGIKKYFDKKTTDSIYSLPYVWKKNLGKGIRNNQDVFALQIYLASIGIYPPEGFSLNDCPVAGSFGNCTSRSLKEFQKNEGLDSNGVVDLKTREKLNNLFNKDEEL